MNDTRALPSILLVDDDPVFTETLRRHLTREGFAAEVALDREAGIQRAIDAGCSLLVLELGPSSSGLEALRRIRARCQVPVLIVTTRSGIVDRIVGLDLGADDYMAKPCAPGELAARIRAILRRVASPAAVASSSTPRSLQVGELTLWPGNRRAVWRGEPLPLTCTEFSLLDALAQQGGQPVSKDTLSRNAFGRPLARFDRRIDVHISSIRQKLGPRADGQSWIVCVRGRGYQLLAD